MAKLLRPAEVARMLDVTPSTVTRWIQDGRLLSIKTPGGQYRIAPEQVAKIMATWDPKESAEVAA